MVMRENSEVNLDLSNSSWPFCVPKMYKFLYLLFMY